MAKKNRITLSQIMAVLALLGICLSVVGTTWLGQQPIPSDIPTSGQLIPGEQTPTTSTDLPSEQK